MEGKLGESHSGELHRETAEPRANRIIAEELARRGWPESELATRRRSDPGKLASAARLRSETTLPIQWIAARGQSGTAKGAKSVLHHLAQSQDQRKTARALQPCAQLEFQCTVLTPFLDPFFCARLLGPVFRPSPLEARASRRQAGIVFRGHRLWAP
jgi:hypothetical protein